MQPGSGEAIVIRGLTKVFRPIELRLRSLRPFRRHPPLTALRGLDLSVGRGEVVGLLGTNGAGKTTLLKILATLILPNAGRVSVHGWDIERETDRVRRLVGVVTGDERTFYWRLTGRQNLEFFAAFHGLAPAISRARIDTLAARLGLDAIDRRFGSYSTGMRHRLAIARALLTEPAVLLLDEPTRSLDPLATADVHRLIRTSLLAERGCTIVLATHDLAEAEALCDRVAILHRGRVVADEPMHALGRAAALSTVFEDVVGRAALA